MHSSVMGFVAGQVEGRALARRSVLEVGSLNVNGSVRSLFTGPYTGIDMRPGPDVDHALNAHDLTTPHARALLPSTSFEVVVCLEMLEHDDRPWVTAQRMRTVAQPGSVLLVTARGYDERGCFPVHGYPDDLWRFSRPGMKALLEAGGWTIDGTWSDPEAPGVFAVAHA